MTLEEPPVYFISWQGPGMTPAVNIPCLVDILEDGITRMPHDIVLADTHL